MPHTSVCQLSDAGLCILQKTKFLAIIGPNGSGKTKCALDILSKLNEEGMKILKLSDIQHWNGSVTANVPCCVWFDDLLENKSDNFIDEHRSIFQTIKACTHIGNVQVVLTIRSDVYENHKSNLSRFLNDESILDLDSDTYQLTRELKEEIIIRHLQARKRDISESIMDDILQSKPLLGFPLCCHLFSSMEYNFQKGAAFFSCPSRELIEAITMLRFSSKEKYLVLAYAALRNKTININDIDEELVNELSQILDAGNISFQTIVHQVVKDKTYFQRQRYKVYAIKHLSIYKAIIVTLSELSERIKQRVINTLQPSILKETLRPEEDAEEEYAYTIVVPESLYPVVARELIQKIEQGYPSLFCCELWNSTHFIDEIVQSLGSSWSIFCLQNFRYGCKYGKLSLIRKMLLHSFDASIGPESIFMGLKEACIKGHDCLVHGIFESKASSAVSADQIIQLINISWWNYDLCIKLMRQLSHWQLDDTQCKDLLSNLTRDDDNCLKLIQEATKKFNVSSKEIVSNTANIAGRRGSLLVLKWMLKNHVEFGDNILHSAMLGVCKRGDCAVFRWILETHEHAIKENLLEYLEHAETPDTVQRLLSYESQLSKFELGELLNKHCVMGHCLIVKVLIDNCDRYSSSDIQNALEVASRYGQLDVFTIICNAFSVPHEERMKIMNAIQSYRGGIKTPMSLNPYTPINYANIPSVKYFYAYRIRNETSTNDKNTSMEKVDQ